ncbi:hypothetical protein BDZ45DRAFT_731964 [Acephala macrosclerotiorum]|nr:hypothetical protein BDZ45DRAFT_731964 [Acephala macrosclerotiorum]
MSGVETRGSKRPVTPEERTHYKPSRNPMEVFKYSKQTLGVDKSEFYMQSIAKFDEGKPAWLKLGGRKGSVEVIIVSRQKDEETGKFFYQVKGVEGILHNNGELVPQEKLDEC